MIEPVSARFFHTGFYFGRAVLPANNNEAVLPSDTTTAPTIRCFNVKYSPNLGDGLLSECLEYALIDLGANPATDSIDLAARRKYGDAMVGRNSIMKLLDLMPSALRRVAVRAPLAMQAKTNWRPHYAARLEGADGVVLGGGNLISDLDLNFPTKLTIAIDEAAKRNLPTAFYACGVASGWSATGLRWCRKSFARPHMKAVFVRDADSKVLWDEMFAGDTGHVAQVVRDPGLLAARYFPAAPKPASERPVAGLNVMSHIAIRYHAEGAPSEARLGDWYVEVAQRLIAEGYQVRAFTNGSPEDKQYAATLHERLRALGPDQDITFLEQRDPAGLCAHISQFDVLIAYRMHAIIAAYSYGIPAVALKWDRKLDSFMRSVGRGDFLFDVAQASAADCVAKAMQAHREGLPADQHAAVLDEAKADVAKLWAVFAR
jgi:polysaccharide pyruvyl transferase WcaK-like protein